MSRSSRFEAFPGETRTAVVLVVTEYPLLAEGLAQLLEGVAVVRRFPAGTLDLAGVVRHTMPDALVTDSGEDEAELCLTAEELSIPLVRILPSPAEVRVFRDGRWGEDVTPIDSATTTIRNVLLGELYGPHAHTRTLVPSSTAERHDDERRPR